VVLPLPVTPMTQYNGFNESSDQNKSVVYGTEAQGHDSLGVLIGFRPFDSGVGSYSDISIYSTGVLQIALLFYCVFQLFSF
jgi:hypothetical protein